MFYFLILSLLVACGGDDVDGGGLGCLWALGAGFACNSLALWASLRAWGSVSRMVVFFKTVCVLPFLLPSLFSPLWLQILSYSKDLIPFWWLEE